MADVKGFGAAGDGKQDDTAAIRHAIINHDGVIEFPRGVYRISETIEIDLGKAGPVGLRSLGGAARILMSVAGPAIRIIGHHQGTAEPKDWKPATWRLERMPLITDLEIEGEHEEADGIELRHTIQATLSHVLIRHVRHGVHLAERNRNVLIESCHIYDNRGIGIFMDRCNLHQMIVSASHISYNREAGILSRNGDLHNIQITGNDIEYNYDQQGKITGSADVWIDATDGTASEITLTSNTIQARPSEGGTNVRLTGPVDGDQMHLVTISANVLGSQSTNLEMRGAHRICVTGNTIYDGKVRGVEAVDCGELALSGNVFGWMLGPKRQMNDSLRFTRCSGVAITGCVIPDGADGDEQQGGAVSFLQSSDSSVSGCQILDPQWRGVWLAGCKRMRISDNTIVRREAKTDEKPAEKKPVDKKPEDKKAEEKNTEEKPAKPVEREVVPPNAKLVAAVEGNEDCRLIMVQNNILAGPVRLPNGGGQVQGNLAVGE